MPVLDPEPTTAVGGTAASDHLLTREVCSLFRFSSTESARDFLRQRGVRPILRGRTFLWRRADILALLNQRQASDPTPP